MPKKIYLKARSSCPRLDHFLVESLRSLSRHRVEKLIASGQVLHNGRPARRKNLPIAQGDRIEVDIREPEKTVYHPSQPLCRLFEDEWLLIIDKPAGIAVHPGSGDQEETILDIFRYHYPQLNEMSEKERPGLVHRIDKDTSGLLLLAKDEPTMKYLQKQFRLRRVAKEYLALVNGHLDRREGVIDAPIGRDLRQRIKFRVDLGGERDDLRSAETRYSLVHAWPRYSLLRVHPLTGRTHQIRVHLSYIGYPVAGDTLYGGRKDKRFSRLALHAHRLEFIHPRSKAIIQARSPFPADLRLFMASLFSK